MLKCPICENLWLAIPPYKDVEHYVRCQECDHEWIYDPNIKKVIGFYFYVKIDRLELCLEGDMVENTFVLRITRDKNNPQNDDLIINEGEWLSEMKASYKLVKELYSNCKDKIAKDGVYEMKSLIVKCSK